MTITAPLRALSTDQAHAQSQNSDFDLPKGRRTAIIFLFCAIIWFIADFPYFLTYLPSGHDLDFHLYRILGLAQGLQDGQFPVRIQTTQINGFGYPVSIMYGDIFLYPAALLVLCGISVNTAYRIFVAVVNLLTIAFTYYISKTVFRSTTISLLATALWALAPYRLEDVFLRTAVGEYVALFFAPLLFFGLYLCFTRRPDLQHRHAWIWLSVGAVGILFSHIVSVILLIIPTAIFCLSGLVFNHSARAWKNLGFAAAAAFGLSLTFLVPFVDYYQHQPFVVSALTTQDKIFRANAESIQPAQLFGLFAPQSGVATRDVATSMPFSLGWAVLGGVATWLVSLLLLQKNEPSKEQSFFGKVLCICAILTLWMSTRLFPWRQTRFPVWNKALGLLGTIQFPWRFIGTALVMLIPLVCIGFDRFASSQHLRYAVKPFALLLICLALLEGGVANTTFLQHSSTQPAPSELVSEDAARSSFGVMTGEYLPRKQKGEKDLLIDRINANDRRPHAFLSKVSDYRKHGTTISFVLSSKKNGSVELPLVMYPHYVVTSPQAAHLRLHTGRSGIMTLTALRKVNAKVTIRFREPASWRVSEIVSLLTAIAMLAFGIASLIKEHDPHRDPTLTAINGRKYYVHQQRHVRRKEEE